MGRLCGLLAHCSRRSVNFRTERSISYFCNILSRSSEQRGRWRQSLRLWRRTETGMAGPQPWYGLFRPPFHLLTAWSQAKLVGVPCGMAVQFILEGVLTKPGVHAPYDEEVSTVSHGIPQGLTSSRSDMQALPRSTGERRGDHNGREGHLRTLTNDTDRYRRDHTDACRFCKIAIAPLYPLPSSSPPYTYRIRN